MIRRIVTAAALTALAAVGGCSGNDSSSSAVGEVSTGPSSDSAAPSSHLMTVFGARDTAAPEVAVDMPRGFDGNGSSWYVVSGDRKQFLGLMTVDRVDADACHAETDSVDAGLSTRDLAEALVAQRSTRASRPDRVTLAGHQGWYLELSGPADLSTCDRHPALWRKPGERPIYGDRQVDQLWILDVAGVRVVVDASYDPRRSSTADIARLRAIVDSLDFE
jgi:hypothetical protein